MAIQVWPVMFGIAIRSSKSQKWNTAIEKSGSGRMRSNTYQLLPSWNISVKYAWLDEEDYQETGIQLPVNTDGSYQCVMKMGNYVEAIEKVDQLKVYVDGTLKAASTYTVSGGTITFNTAPASGAVVTATYRYYWKVHLPDDGISVDHVFTNLKQTGTIKFESWR